MRTGFADTPLHSGKAPSWLLKRMIDLAGAIIYLLADLRSPKEVLVCLSDPFWFQALGCVVGFDWHSSGLTTTLTYAIKEGLKKYPELGIFGAGGKGKHALKTPEEIDRIAEIQGINRGKELIRVSRLTAKVDSSAVSDSFSLYHHFIIFTTEGDWAVIQQGMNPNGWARRYHWLSDGLSSFVEEPHSSVVGRKTENVVDLTSKGNSFVREVVPELVTRGEVEKLRSLVLPKDHWFSKKHVDVRKLKATFEKIREFRPSDFTQLLEIRGVGEKTLLALSLIAELLTSKPVEIKDPARFSYALGGKDGIPYPVRKKEYDEVRELFHVLIRRLRTSGREKDKMIFRLERFLESIAPQSTRRGGN